MSQKRVSLKKFQLTTILGISGWGLFIGLPRAIAQTPRPSNGQLQQNSQTVISDGLQLAQVEVEGCPRAEVVEEYETYTYLAYICQTSSGDFFYRGINKNSGQQINIMGVLSTDSGTYYATNGNITYWINNSELQVTENDEVIFSEPVIRHSF